MNCYDCDRSGDATTAVAICDERAPRNANFLTRWRSRRALCSTIEHRTLPTRDPSRVP